jgi:CspA family cold shock protein
MPVGLVKWFDAKKGFGFVSGPSGEDVFVHYTVIEGDGFRRLRDGEQVEYEFTQGPKGLLATRVIRVNPEASMDQVDGAQRDLKLPPSNE